jgi:hypothetical protein
VLTVLDRSSPLFHAFDVGGIGDRGCDEFTTRVPSDA